MQGGDSKQLQGLWGGPAHPRWGALAFYQQTDGSGPPDQNLEDRRSHENFPPTGVPRRIELGSRRWSQVRLPEYSEEAEGEVHPQGRTEGPQAGGDGDEFIWQGKRDKIKRNILIQKYDKGSF